MTISLWILNALNNTAVIDDTFCDIDLSIFLNECQFFLLCHNQKQRVQIRMEQNQKPEKNKQRKSQRNLLQTNDFEPFFFFIVLLMFTCWRCCHK